MPTDAALNNRASKKSPSARISSSRLFAPSFFRREILGSSQISALRRSEKREPQARGREKRRDEFKRSESYRARRCIKPAAILSDINRHFRSSSPPAECLPCFGVSSSFNTPSCCRERRAQAFLFFSAPRILNLIPLIFQADSLQARPSSTLSSGISAQLRYTLPSLRRPIRKFGRTRDTSFAPDRQSNACFELTLIACFQLLCRPIPGRALQNSQQPQPTITPLSLSLTTSTLIKPSFGLLRLQV